jgi:hypothetical protein
MAVGGWVVNEAFDKAERARAVRKEDRRWVCPSCRPISMPASPARLMVLKGGVEVTRILTRVSEAGAPAGGAAVAAPERGALPGPSAPTSTSTRWALVTMQPCHAWHGWGLNEVPAAAIRRISSCREAMYGGFWKNIISIHRHMDLPLGQSDMSFPRLSTRKYSPDEGAGAAFAKCFLAKQGTDGSAEGRGCWSWRRRVGKQRWGMALASSRQPCESFKYPLGARPDATQDGGGSQPEKRHGLVAAVLRITAAGITRYGGFLGKYSRTHHLLRTGDSIHVFYQPLP